MGVLARNAKEPHFLNETAVYRKLQSLIKVFAFDLAVVFTGYCGGRTRNGSEFEWHFLFSVRCRPLAGKLYVTQLALEYSRIVSFVISFLENGVALRVS